MAAVAPALPKALDVDEVITPALEGLRLHRFTVDEFHKMDSEGYFAATARHVELLDGLIVEKAIVEPPHAASQRRIVRWLNKVIPDAWFVDKEVPITLSASEPIPHVAVIVGQLEDYDRRHPKSSEIGLVIEVADSTLYSDRKRKRTIYAGEGISRLWLVNLHNRTIEVSTEPLMSERRYAVQAIYSADQEIPFILNEVVIASIPVSDLLPSRQELD